MTAVDLQEKHTTSDERMLHYPTNFGDVALRDDRLISFPKGLLGLAWCTVFGLSRMPNSDDSPLLLLQCVNDPTITFLCAEPGILGTPLQEEDEKKALKEVGYSPKNSQFLAILTLYNHGGESYLTANLRAPVIIDSSQRVGVQHVLSNQDYSTQQKV